VGAEVRRVAGEDLKETPLHELRAALVALTQQQMAQSSRHDKGGGLAAQGMVLYEDTTRLPPPADNNQKRLATARAKALGLPFPMWSPGVRAESRPEKRLSVASTGVQIVLR